TRKFRLPASGIGHDWTSLHAAKAAKDRASSHPVRRDAVCPADWQRQYSTACLQYIGRDTHMRALVPFRVTQPSFYIYAVFESRRAHGAPSHGPESLKPL